MNTSLTDPNGIKSNYNMYKRIHRYVRISKGRASKCVQCGDQKAKRYEWALKHGCRYDFNLDNFIELCVRCHKRYDMTPDLHNILKESRKGESFLKKMRETAIRRKVVMMDVNGSEIKVFDSIKQASIEMGVGRTAIMNHLAKASGVCGGYKWKYAN